MNLRETPWGLTESQLITKWKHVVDACSHIFTWTSRAELAFLAELASRSTSICEIGSYHGRSALTMALANPGCKILCIDNAENEEVPALFGRNLCDPMDRGQVAFWPTTSRALILPAQLRFDACFIDAGHLEKDVSEDISHLKPRMLDGSMMCGHDWRQHDHNDGVNRAVVAAFGKPQWVFESIWAVTL